MSETKDYFFCGIGGSGMLPLAMIVNARGAHVEGSDRALDQGRSNAKFDYLRDLGIALHPQDGSGLVRASQILVASAAVEDTVPDVVAANKLGASRLSRAALLAKLFNESRRPIGVAGTSGKSTTTGMIGWILHHAGHSPTVMNGAVMKNFVTDDALFASALVGDGDEFVSEVDESDGSIAMFSPKIAVLNNISLDHKTMDELRALFGGFIGRSELAVLNLDNDETARLAKSHEGGMLTYSLRDDSADLFATKIRPQPFGVSFTVLHKGSESADISLKMPGRHNVSNALAAIAAARACGVPLADAAAALGEFLGVRRRLEFVGTEKEITLIDDFGHNPDKITASLKTLHEFPGRLLVMFQPHGFGPLKKMKSEFIETFVNNLGPDDVLIMPQPVYFGGTVDRSVNSDDIVKGVNDGGRKAVALPDRDACRDYIEKHVKSGDRVIIMGARDDTLSDFAQSILQWIAGR
ncbi:UDP-N-acetylmuramate--L-alanine ligase [Hyphococcus sp. DH-69]|uniref:UDP-N-acetylmuramate--L-alanine ligase n=1 Tax=Hyphococcus formosus TaxID=3143534 RepID=UPI00398A905B